MDLARAASAIQVSSGSLTKRRQSVTASRNRGLPAGFANFANKFGNIDELKKKLTALPGVVPLMDFISLKWVADPKELMAPLVTGMKNSMLGQMEDSGSLEKIDVEFLKRYWNPLSDGGVGGQDAA